MRGVAAATVVVLVGASSIAHAEHDSADQETLRISYFGAELDLPPDLTLRGSVYNARPGGPLNGYLEIAMQIASLFSAAPHLDPGQQQQSFGVRAGWLPVVFSRFAVGAGAVWDVSRVGVPVGWKLSDDRDGFNAIGPELTVLMDLGFGAKRLDGFHFQVVGHAAYEVGVDHLRRPVIDGGVFLSFPFVTLSARAIYSSFDYGASPSSNFDARPRAQLSGLDLLFGVGLNVEWWKSRWAEGAH